MATQIVTCPSCGSRYQTVAEAGRQLPCRQCGAVLTIPSQSTMPSSLANQRQPRQKKGLSLDPELKPFLKRLGLGIGIICSLILLAGAIGWFFEPIAMGAVILGITAMVALALAGLIWMVVIAFQESVGLGVASIFVPLMWVYLLVKRIGRSQLALALLVSSLIPAMVTLGVISLSEKRYSASGRSAARATNLASKADQFAETIHQYESNNPPTDEPREAAYSYVIQIDNPPKFVTDGDRVLGQFAGYVKGSLTVDQEQRTISYQHRGTNELESMYRLYLSAKAGVPIRPRSK